jgi:hypothetical protein
LLSKDKNHPGCVSLMAGLGLSGIGKRPKQPAE